MGRGAGWGPAGRTAEEELASLPASDETVADADPNTAGDQAGWQVDGGSEFAAVFEQACLERGIKLFVLPPRSPKLNGQVERANRTHTEEFYEITPFSLPIAELNRELLAWEQTYNTIRPHQALGYLTPQQFLAQSSLHRKEPKCH